SDLKRYGTKMIFSNLRDDLKMLSTKGITVNILEQEFQIYFLVASFLGDNLGIHTLLGFTESFRASYYCRFCKSSRDEASTMVVHNDITLRNKDNYAKDLLIDNISSTGIKENCIWNTLKAYHVTENFGVDLSHDIFEGIAAFDMAEILYQYIVVQKLFSISVLNSRVKYFNYGVQNVNKPPLFTLANVKNIMC
ncbi:hypothetical protein PPYR_15603, partial [Photinus pyralis]